jgi:hypothetical protein
MSGHEIYQFCIDNGTLIKKNTFYLFFVSAKFNYAVTNIKFRERSERRGDEII